MNIPVETKPALWGAAGGALALAIIGFAWGGWTTGGKADLMAQTRANDAVVAVLAPVCVDKFEKASDAPANKAALMKVDSWAQAEFVEKGGWAASSPGSTPEQMSAVAKACAALLAQGK